MFNLYFIRTIGNKLKVVYGVKVINVSENFVQYYGLAVVKKGTPFNLKQLKGKDSCHTGVGRTVGWRIPVGYLLYKKEMNFTCDQYQSVAEFFDKSCAPGRFVKLTTDNFCCELPNDGNKAKLNLVASFIRLHQPN